MTKTRSKPKTNPIKNKTTVDGQVFFTYQGKQYAAHKYCDSMLHRESDNLGSVTYDRKTGLHVITTTADFGGLGKDARKPYIIPFGAWLNQYCTIVE